MKERPILFSGAMVRAILDGKKTQTRRIFKGTTEHKGEYNPDYLERWKGDKGWADICPYGRIGDHLWVRETWSDHEVGEPVLYRASVPIDDDVDRDFKWRPSIFMPRWASRITLEIVNVRVERLQEISGSDAKAEGITMPLSQRCEFQSEYAAYISAYRDLWDSINGKGAWGLNPWVWAIEFERVKP